MKDPGGRPRGPRREELGLRPGKTGNPWQAAGSSFVTFSIGAVIPLTPWFFVSGALAALLSIVLGAIAVLAVGWTVAIFTGRSGRGPRSVSWRVRDRRRRASRSGSGTSSAASWTFEPPDPFLSRSPEYANHEARVESCVERQEWRCSGSLARSRCRLQRRRLSRRGNADTSGGPTSGRGRRTVSVHATLGFWRIARRAGVTDGEPRPELGRD